MPGKYLIKAASIAFLILALASVVVLLTGGLVTRAAAEEANTLRHASAVVALVSAALPAALALIAGCLGLVFAAHPKAGKFLAVVGLLTFACAAVPFLADVIADGFFIRNVWQYLAAMAVAIIYIIGALLNRIVVKKKPTENDFDN